MYSGGGGGIGYNIFRYIFYKPIIKTMCDNKLAFLNHDYICIQIRNTDRMFDYQSLYEKNKDTIHSYENVYISTDDKNAIIFYKSKNLNVFNFCDFPDKRYKNLHTSYISSESKFTNMLVDLYIGSKSKLLLSTSRGGFIHLMRNCNYNKKQF